MSDRTVDLAGKVAVVTGAGTGIGRGIALALAATGADLLLHYRASARTIQDVAAECRALGSQVELEAADFAADPGRAAAIVDVAARNLGRVDVLINNAAITTHNEPFLSISRGQMEEMLAVNVVAPMLATQAAARHMMEAGRGGRIINIGSVHIRQAAPGYAAYEVSKAAIESLTRSGAIALGPHGITVNCVAPGTVVVERYAEGEWDEAWVTGRTPVGRLGTPADIAAVVAFLASDAASYVNGETIFVDGGMSRRMPLVK